MTEVCSGSAASVRPPGGSFRSTSTNGHRRQRVATSRWANFDLSIAPTEDCFPFGCGQTHMRAVDKSTSEILRVHVFNCCPHQLQPPRQLAPFRDRFLREHPGTIAAIALALRRPAARCTAMHTTPLLTLDRRRPAWAPASRPRSTAPARPQGQRLP